LFWVFSGRVLWFRWRFLRLQRICGLMFLRTGLWCCGRRILLPYFLVINCSDSWKGSSPRIRWLDEVTTNTPAFGLTAWSVGHLMRVSTIIVACLGSSFCQDKRARSIKRQISESSNFSILLKTLYTYSILWNLMKIEERYTTII